MYICLCNAITDRELLAQREEAAMSVERAYQALGYQPLCGKCVPFAQQLLCQAAETANREIGGDD
jgi:bacterioferritin-associated ferredoxin